MSQFDFGDLESPLSGTNLINSNLEPWRDALHSCHSGTSRPSYATAGMLWLDTTGTPWILNMFDGSDDIPVMQVNATTNTINLVSISNGDINITPNGTGRVVIGGLQWPSADGTADQVITTDGAGNLTFADGGAGLSDVTLDTFVAGVDFTAGSTTQVTLSVTPPSENNTSIYFDGVYQEKGEYSIAGAVVTFTSAIPTGTTSVEVVTGGELAVGTPSDGTVTTAKLADDAVTNVKLADDAVTLPKIDSTGATNGQVLTADGAGAVTFADAAGGGSMVLLGSFSASNVTSVDIGSGLDLNTVIDGTYDRYVLQMVSVSSSSNSASLYLRTSSNTGVSFDSGASDYSWARIAPFYTTPNVAADSADAQIILNDTNFRSDEFGYGTVELFTPSEAGRLTALQAKFGVYRTAAGSDNALGFRTHGLRKATAVVDALQLLFSSGNIASGEFYLYGISKT